MQNPSVTAIVMELREWLMEYFKGDCVARVTGENNIIAITKSAQQRFQYGWQRREWEMKQERLVHYKGHIICEVSQSPASLTFHAQTGDTFPRVIAKLEKFMTAYLPGVEVSHQATTSGGGYAINMRPEATSNIIWMESGGLPF